MTVFYHLYIYSMKSESKNANVVCCERLLFLLYTYIVTNKVLIVNFLGDVRNLLNTAQCLYHSFI